MTFVRCPTCDRKFDTAKTDAMPFCSQRCRLVDLGMWLDERHGMMVERDPDDLDENPLGG